MRVISFFFKSLMFLVVVGGLTFLISREVLLNISITQLKTGTSTLRAQKLQPGQPTVQCTNSPFAEVPVGIVEALQLTFTTNQAFQAELVCDSSIREPMILASFKLAPFVTKKPGSSGLLWGKTTTGLTLQLWGRQKSVILSGGELISNDGPLQIALQPGPIATCNAYGFTCCGEASGLGQGDQTMRVRDCPASCFALCVARPVLLAFTSQPFADPATRSLTLSDIKEVTFNYVVDFGAAKGGTVTIYFGDGQTQMLTDSSGSFTHQYLCAANACEYQSILTVSDTQGLQAMATNLSMIKIRASN